MKRGTLISLIDVIAFIAFLFLTSSGILLRYLLPPGSGRWSEIWGMSRHQWGELHFWFALLFFTVLALHLLQHWRFVLGLFRGHIKEALQLRVTLGVVGLIAAIMLAIAPLISPVQSEENQVGRSGYRGGQGFHPPAQPETEHER